MRAPNQAVIIDRIKEFHAFFIKSLALSLTIYGHLWMSSQYYQLKSQKKEKHESISKSKEFNGKALTNILRSTILSLLTPLTLKSGSTTPQFAPIGDIDNVSIEWKTIIVFDLIYSSRSVSLSAVVLFIPFKGLTI